MDLIKGCSKFVNLKIQSMLLDNDFVLKYYIKNKIKGATFLMTFFANFVFRGIYCILQNYVQFL